MIMGIPWITKVKIFWANNFDVLENFINDFIADKIVKDIKFIPHLDNKIYAFIIYEERGKES